MTDRDLIFLVSQPRAGSTLLQRMLGRHSAVHTTTEPWLMLDPVLACMREQVRGDHTAGGWSVLARDSFLKAIHDPHALDGGVRALGMHVYEKALAESGKQMFLDKTPRYYGILPELAQLFPDARFIVLLRNPASVMCSVIRTWVQEHWERLSSYRFDLMNAPSDLVNGLDLLGHRATSVCYEDLVADPGKQIDRICASLGLEACPDMFECGGEARLPFGDPVSEASRKADAPDHAERWLADVEHPQVWRFVYDYLTQLGAPLLSRMGYNYEELMNQLRSHQPVAVARWMTHSLESMLIPGAVTDEASSR